MRLKSNFFKRNTVVVAKQLLGKYLYRRINGKVVCARITETEAYCGIKDKACHSSKGLTERTKVMFGPPGHAYVYLVYGMYHCFNAVTREKGCPEAVLIRKVTIANYELGIINKGRKTQNHNSLFNIHNSNLLNGPGKLCRSFKIDRTLNGIDLCKSKELWIESANWRKGKKPFRIKMGKRIGVDYAGKWKDKMWRFYL